MNLQFIEEIEDTISSSFIVVSSDIQKYFSSSKKEAYIKGKLTFIDLSFLEFSILNPAWICHSRAGGNPEKPKNTGFRIKCGMTEKHNSIFGSMSR